MIRSINLFIGLLFSLFSYADEQPNNLNIWVFPIYNMPITINKLYPLTEKIEVKTNAILSFTVSSDLSALEDSCKTKQFDIVLIPIHADISFSKQCNLNKIAKSVSLSHLYTKNNIPTEKIKVIGMVRHTGSEKGIRLSGDAMQTPKIVYFNQASSAIMALEKGEVDAIFMLEAIMESSLLSVVKGFRTVPRTSKYDGANIYLNTTLSEYNKDLLKDIIESTKIAGVLSFEKI